MPRPAHHDGLDKFKRYRARREAAGRKLVRLWLPDPAAAGFAEEIARQARTLRGAPEEAEALTFIDAVADWGDPTA